ncbi:MAG: serine hydrolase [Pseudomonadota bacterium]
MPTIKTAIIALAGLLSLLLLLGAAWFGPGAVALPPIIVSAACNITYTGRQPKDLVLQYDFNGMGDDYSWLELRFDDERQAVSLDLFGNEIAASFYKRGYGCAADTAARRALPEHRFADVVTVPTLVDVSSQFPQLNALIKDEFASDGEGLGTVVNHRAALVLHQGRIVAEHYVAPYSEETRFQSQSMAKTINALLWAAADMQGLAIMDNPVQAPEWPKDDPRQAITNRDLLNMSSGLDFEENYETSVTTQYFKMLSSGDLGGFAARLELAYEPGMRWYYSGADSNLAARSLRAALDENNLTVSGFAEQALFSKIGARDIELVTDDSGTFWAASFVFASARNWARIGQLILDRGMVEGEPVVPADFIDALATPLPSSNGQYRHSFWLNRGLEFGEERAHAPGLPEDTLSLSGYGGQKVHVIPSGDMVIVRLGRAEGPEGYKGYRSFISKVYAAAMQDLEAEITAAGL